MLWRKTAAIPDGEVGFDSLPDVPLLFSGINPNMKEDVNREINNRFYTMLLKDSFVHNELRELTSNQRLLNNIATDARMPVRISEAELKAVFERYGLSKSRAEMITSDLFTYDPIQQKMLIKSDYFSFDKDSNYAKVERYIQEKIGRSEEYAEQLVLLKALLADKRITKAVINEEIVKRFSDSKEILSELLNGLPADTTAGGAEKVYDRTALLKRIENMHESFEHYNKSFRVPVMALCLGSSSLEAVKSECQDNIKEAQTAFIRKLGECLVNAKKYITVDDNTRLAQREVSQERMVLSVGKLLYSAAYRYRYEQETVPLFCLDEHHSNGLSLDVQRDPRYFKSPEELRQVHQNGVYLKHLLLTMLQGQATEEETVLLAREQYAVKKGSLHQLEEKVFLNINQVLDGNSLVEYSVSKNIRQKYSRVINDVLARLPKSIKVITDTPGIKQEVLDFAKSILGVDTYGGAAKSREWLDVLSDIQNELTSTPDLRKLMPLINVYSTLADREQRAMVYGLAGLALLIFFPKLYRKFVLRRAAELFDDDPERELIKINGASIRRVDLINETAQGFGHSA